MTTTDYVMGVTQSLLAGALVATCRTLYRKLRSGAVTYSRILEITLWGIPMVPMSLLLWFFFVTFIAPQHFISPVAIWFYHWAFPTSVGLAFVLMLLTSVLSSFERRKSRRHRLMNSI
jgi:hypothetical protein